jgi:hypothetical protein
VLYRETAVSDFSETSGIHFSPLRDEV